MSFRPGVVSNVVICITTRSRHLTQHTFKDQKLKALSEMCFVYIVLRFLISNLTAFDLVGKFLSPSVRKYKKWRPFRPTKHSLHGQTLIKITINKCRFEDTRLASDSRMPDFLGRQSISFLSLWRSSTYVNIYLEIIYSDECLTVTN